MQAGDLEFGNIENIDYFKVGSGKSKLGPINSEIDSQFEFNAGSVGLVRGDEFNTEDSEFFILLKDVPLFKGEYTPIGVYSPLNNGTSFNKIKNSLSSVLNSSPRTKPTLPALNSNWLSISELIGPSLDLPLPTLK